MFNLSVIRTGKCVVVQGRDGEIALSFPDSLCAQYAEEHIIETVACTTTSIKANHVQHAIGCVELGFGGVVVEKQ
jgi:hypothetical protein